MEGQNNFREEEEKRRRTDIQYDNMESKIFRESDNPESGFSLTEQVIHCTVCYLAHGKLAWIFHKPDTELDDCLNILLSTSSYWVYGGEKGDREGEE